MSNHTDDCVTSEQQRRMARRLMLYLSLNASLLWLLSYYCSTLYQADTGTGIWMGIASGVFFVGALGTTTVTITLGAVYQENRP